jgi:hypothetical protein
MMGSMVMLMMNVAKYLRNSNILIVGTVHYGFTDAYVLQESTTTNM